jgi:hypothetical protein
MSMHKKCQAHVEFFFVPLMNDNVHMEQFFFLCPQSKYGFSKSQHLDTYYGWT